MFQLLLAVVEIDCLQQTGNVFILSDILTHIYTYWYLWLYFIEIRNSLPSCNSIFLPQRYSQKENTLCCFSARLCRTLAQHLLERGIKGQKTPDGRNLHFEFDALTFPLNSPPKFTEENFCFTQTVSGSPILL